MNGDTTVGLKTLIVIGSVSSRQYKPVRTNIYRQLGLNVAVRRATDNEFYLEAEELLNRYGTPGEITAPHSGATLLQLAEKHLATFGDVGAIVMDEITWDNYGTNGRYIKEALCRRPEGCPRWIAYQDRHVELAG